MNHYTELVDYEHQATGEDTHSRTSDATCNHGRSNGIGINGGGTQEETNQLNSGQQALLGSIPPRKRTALL